MAAITSSVTHETSPRAGRASYVVSNGVTIPAGALVALGAGGYLTNLTDTLGYEFVGIALETVTGNTSVSPAVECRVNIEGLTLKGVAVASLTQANVGDLVYCESNNVADMDLTASTNLDAVGYVSRFISAGLGDVTLFTPAEHLGL